MKSNNWSMDDGNLCVGNWKLQRGVNKSKQWKLERMEKVGIKWDRNPQKSTDFQEVVSLSLICETGSTGPILQIRKPVLRAFGRPCICLETLLIEPQFC